MLMFIIYKLMIFLSLLMITINNKWLVIWIILELITICMVSMLSQSSSMRSVEAMMKYYLIQSVASIFILVGLKLKVYYIGSLELIGPYNYYSQVLLLMGAVMKLGVFPNPYWFIDVVSGVPGPRLIYILIMSKLVSVYLLYFLYTKEYLIFASITGLVSVIFGSMFMLNQVNFRKMLAGSSMANMGWFILGFPFLSVKNMFFIILMYFIALIPILWVLNDFEMNTMASWSSFYFDKFKSICIVIPLLSLGGFIPFLGFASKWMILKALVSKDYILVSIILVLFSLLSFYVYLRLSFMIMGLVWPEMKVFSLINMSSTLTVNILYSFIRGIMMIGLIIMIISMMTIGVLISMFWM